MRPPQPRKLRVPSRFYANLAYHSPLGERSEPIEHPFERNSIVVDQLFVKVCEKVQSGYHYFLGGHRRMTPNYDQLLSKACEPP